MRLAVFLTVASEWARALAGPIVLMTGSGALLLVVWRAGIDRLWLLGIIGAVGVGFGTGWAGLVATTHSRRQQAKRHASEGEGEPL